jgi:hypothetical protein
MVCGLFKSYFIGVSLHSPTCGHGSTSPARGLAPIDAFTSTTLPGCTHMRTCPYGPLRSALYIVHTRTNGTLLPLFRTEFRPTHLTTNALLPKTPHSQLRCLMPRLQWQPFVPHDDNERLEQDKLSWACARINGGKPIPHVTVWGGAPLLSSANCTRGSHGPYSEKPSSPAAAANQDNQLPPRRSGLRRPSKYPFGAEHSPSHRRPTTN